MNEKIRISYFSDVLCVWAYIAQIRLDELKLNYVDKLDIHYHFIPLFGCTEKRIGEGWKDKGGFKGFGDHVKDVCSQFDHVDVHADIWTTAIAKSSATSHLFLKSVKLLEEKELTSKDPVDGNNTLFEQIAWEIRLAFFKDGLDISHMDTLFSIAQKHKLPTDKLKKLIDNGEALASLCRDVELRDEYRVEGSPTFILNEGRQKLYGNLGYKIIEANVQEVLNRPENQATWC
ncbi:MAG: putative DsbA family dithiol-disulfide isomerase [Gammaproteobacteria bacterium]|jgi:predicted DsbA family dithiol-disulfide isomerase